MIKSRIILNGRDVDLINDIDMPLNYQIADVRFPEKKNTNFTKTITLPGTAINDDLFGFLWDTNVIVNSSGTINYNPSFNPNKKADCQILYDGSEVFKGYMKLNKINILEDYQVSYDVTCYGKLKDLFLALGELTLADIDLTKYNHPYTRHAQQGSWDSFIYSNNTTTAFTLGEGYVYPMVDYALNNDIDYKTADFFPAIYYKTIIREIINQAGFSFDGDIFDNNDFKSLAVSYGRGTLQLSQSQVANRTFRASNTSTQYALSSGTISTQYISFNDDTTAPNNDAGGVYNTGTNTFICAVSGTYKITFWVNVSATHVCSPSPATLVSDTLGYVAVERNGVNINSVNVNIVPTGQAYGTTVINIFDSSPVTNGTTSAAVNGAVITNVNLTAGDTLKCKFVGAWVTSTNCYGQTPSATSHTRLNFTPSSYFTAEMASVVVNEGDTVDMNAVLPSTIKQKDFISSFFKLFNIYTEDDRYTDNLLHLNTRPDFYATSGTTRDWSEKLDTTKDYQVIPMGDLDARTYLYKFKDDGDYWNEYYKKKYNETYGQKKYDIDNDWLSNTNTTEAIFSPTPLVDRAGSDRVIPRIFQVNNNGQATPKTSNLRLWYYGGVKTTVNTWNYVTSSGTIQMSTYPYAGHLNNVQFPTYDVNYFSPIEVYYTATSYTDGNLFNRYHKQFIDEITNKDSKMLVGYFHVTPYDISILNFRDAFYIRGDYWRLNKITDYNPVEENKTTLCEFIKLTGGTPFTATSGTTNGGANVTIGTDTAPTFSERTAQYGNYGGTNAIVRGNNNIVAQSAMGIIVNGDSNSIGENARNISILNSSGTTVAGGVQNVSIINSNDLTIDDRYNGLSVVDGHINGGKRITYKTSNYKGVAADLGHYVLFVLSGNGTTDLPEPATIYNGWSVEIKNANNSGYTLTVNALTDYTQLTCYFEDGVSTTDIINNNESFTYTYRNGIWYIS